MFDINIEAGRAIRPGADKARFGMFKRMILAAACVTAFSMISTSAATAEQGQCNSRDNVIKLLGKKYKEAPVAAGVTSNGKLVEVLSNSSGTTWTIILTSPQGVSCLIVSGEGWRTVPRVGLDPEV